MEYPAGRLVLLFVFVGLLGGRFTLDRIWDGIGAFDLRWVALYVAAASAALWAGAVAHYAGGRVSRPLLSFRMLFLAWAFWMALSAAWSPRAARTDSYLLDLFFMASLIAIATSVLSRCHPRVTDSVWVWMVSSGVIYFISAVVQGPDAQGRYSAIGGGPNVFVRVMALGALAAICIATTRRARWVLLTMPLFITGAVMSGSRGGLLAMLVVTTIGGWPLLRGIRASLGMALLSFAGTCLAIWLIWRHGSSAIVDRLVDQTWVNRYDSGRAEILAGAIDIFSESPIIGAGLDGYYAVAGIRQAYEYPHNLVVAVAAESGIIGLVLLLAPMVFAVRNSLVGNSPHTLPPFALLGAAYLLVASMFSGDYYDSRFMWFFLALAIAQNRRRSMDPDLEPPKRRDNAGPRQVAIVPDSAHAGRNLRVHR